MRNVDEHNITDAVVARIAACPDPRLKEILTSLVRHLHGFVRETGLSEAEWLRGIEFLTATGHITNERRQEFILLSDTLGVSMLTVAQNHGKAAGVTEATVFGPFHVVDAPRFEDGADIAEGAPGEPLFVECRIVDQHGVPIAAATVDVWQPMPTASMTSSTVTSTCAAPVACCRAMRKAGCASAASCRWPIRCRSTARSGRC